MPLLLPHMYPVKWKTLRIRVCLSPFGCRQMEGPRPVTEAERLANAINGLIRVIRGHMAASRFREALVLINRLLIRDPDHVGLLELKVDCAEYLDLRGGGRVLSRREEHGIRAKVDAEFESRSREPSNAKRKKVQKKTRATDDDLGSLFGDGHTAKLPRFANKITLKNISPGMKLLGVISEVDEKDLVISLPGGLRGLVRACDAFDRMSYEAKSGAGCNFLPSIFHVGQLVPCVVLQLDDDNKDKGKQKIWLSLCLSLLYKDLTLDSIQEGMVLTAYVKTIEDHGYVLHFGLLSFTGFCPKNSSQTGSKEIKVNTGQLLQGFVRSIDKVRKVVHLSSDPDIVSKCVTKDLKGLSMHLLIPGMMVNACVRRILDNGIMLSFLTYFTGTVDIFHLQKMFPTANWKDDYHQNMKVNARILFIDPSTRAIGLTLNPYIVHNNAPPSHVKLGDIYDHSRVIRVDREWGLLLEIPTVPVSTPAYVTKSDIADEGVRKLDKRFKDGGDVRCRILGIRHMEGLAVGALKASAFEESLFIHSDVKPGMVVKAKVFAVKSFGALVQFPSGVKALCPLRHMSEFEITKPRKKFKVGAEFMFRVLGCKSKRITVTHKKTLVKSKLEILSSYDGANEGLVTHGWISKIEKHGCFVRFYNGVQGFAPRSELGLEPGCDTSSIFHVEQVVKCRVTSFFPASRRINLSFIIKPSRISEEDMVKLGSLVSGVVERVTSDSIILQVEGRNYLKGSMSAEHLSDHAGHAALMKSFLKPGYLFEQLLVLDIEGKNLVLTAKHSLVNSAKRIPLDLTQIQHHSVVHGYICNLIDTGCFVRFLGRLTGFCPKDKAMDDERADFPEAFYIGQSVRSYIHNVDTQTGRITVSLKQSYCSSTDASFLQDYFLSEEQIANKLQLSEAGSAESQWVSGFNIGSIVEGKVREANDFGVVINFEKYHDVAGFIAHYQLNGMTVEAGSTIRAAVLDVAKVDRLVELSLKPEFVNKFKEETTHNQTLKKKRKRDVVKDLEVHQTVNVIVEIVKDNYLVLSLPEYNYALGFASAMDYNTQKFPLKQFQNGQSITATIMALASSTTAGRLLLLLKSISLDTDTSNSKRAKKKSRYNVGSLVQAEVTDIKPLELRLKFGIGFRGRVHITEITDNNAAKDPFSSFKIGQTVNARILAKANQFGNGRKNFQWELSVKPTVLTCFSERDNLGNEVFNFSTGQSVTGFVYKVDYEWAWLTISRHVKAQLFLLDSAVEPSELQEFQKRFCVGKAVSGYVLNANKDKRLLRLVLSPLSAVSNGKVAGEVHSIRGLGNDNSKENMISHIHEGDIVGGRISKVLPGVGGLVVRIAPHLFGKVHFCELADSWVPNPLSGYQEGQFVKCKVLEICNTERSTVHIDLSLRLAVDDVHHTKFSGFVKSENMVSPSKCVENIADLHPDMFVQGYVKNMMPKGCFILLSRKLDARILLSNLSDKYIENPEEEFPVGKLVIGKVLSIEPLSKRVEVTLKTSNRSILSATEINDLSSLHVGDFISGTIRRVEPYGLFIMINNTNLVGLCHVSELSDACVDNIESKYRAGEGVTAKILKVDEDRHRISLGMKNSYFGNDTDFQMASNQRPSDTGKENSLTDGINMLPKSSLPMVQTVDMEGENVERLVLAQAESRASIHPLEVVLEDRDHSDCGNLVGETQKHVTGVAGIEKDLRKAKRKAEVEREREIRAAEERLLEQDMPRTADEFEKLIRSSPDSSFVWIKYMEFMLSLADIEKARSIAERALRTINIREESEKLNVWVAYLNLENRHGNPPEEAVNKIFQRALQYCDPETLHLALLGMYEKTGQDKLADELLDKMVKKFRRSHAVWFRRIEFILKQNLDGVQSVVNRALLSLPHHEHISFISRTAILEFKCGVPERGRSMFEGILREYPKRTDLWNIYLDQEIRLGDGDAIRALFERAICLIISSKKMEPIFEKYLKYEKSIGNEDRIEYVKKRAMDYVNSLC